MLQFRDVTVDGQQGVEALVQWQDLPSTEATWEDFVQLQQSFPMMIVEDKVRFDGGIMMRLQSHEHQTGDQTG